jgi:hypothetical protein
MKHTEVDREECGRVAEGRPGGQVFWVRCGVQVGKIQCCLLPTSLHTGGPRRPFWRPHVSVHTRIGSLSCEFSHQTSESTPSGSVAIPNSALDRFIRSSESKLQLYVILRPFHEFSPSSYASTLRPHQT